MILYLDCAHDCDCGCEADGDWHWSGAGCQCVNQGCRCVRDAPGHGIIVEIIEPRGTGRASDH